MQAGQTLMRSRLGPCAMRLYDETETKTHVSKVFGINLDHGAYLVFGFDGRKDIVDLQMKYAREIMEGEFKGRRSWSRRWTRGGASSRALPCCTPIQGAS